jgi:hypothetical protein
MSDTNKERKNVVREAWKNERAHVREGKGTRDWSQSEQKQIVAKGRASGYEGHHMKSVKEYPQHTGNPQNIQFLSRSEHVNGAHKGNTQNPTNGYYNHTTGTTHSFGTRDPIALQSQTLTVPLTQRQQDIEIKRERARQQAAKQAKAEKKQAVTKTMPNNTQVQNTQQNAQPPVTPANRAAVNKGIDSMRSKEVKAQTVASSNTAQPSHNKGIEAAQQKVAAKQSGTNTGQTSNQGIKSYQNKAAGQSVSKSSTSSMAKGTSNSSESNIKSGGSPIGGKSNGNGQSR